MTRLPAIDRYAERAMESGLVCSGCGCEFTKPHGHPVVCWTCGRETMIEALALRGLRIATRHEVNRNAHRERAVKVRSVKQARLERAQQENAE